MLLLIPEAVKNLKREGRNEERARIREILEQMENEAPPEVIDKLKSRLFEPNIKQRE